jgi:hypothetical protein
MRMTLPPSAIQVLLRAGATIDQVDRTAGTDLLLVAASMGSRSCKCFVSGRDHYGPI